ncbi:MAG: radical SAM protein [Candidatus Kuenenbacteria bacterium]
MIEDINKYFNYFKHQFFLIKKLNFLILYITSKCNFKCKTCFFHEHLNKNNDLTLSEYKKISENLGNISILLLSGGEPFLNPCLEDICSIFVKKNKIETLYIPTNGFFTDKILSVTESLLKKFPNITLSLNPSLDGMLNYHEQLRNVKGSFNNAIKTIEGLTLLKKKYKNLQIIVNSVIHHNNLNDIKNLSSFLKKFNIDYHAFEVMRGNIRNKNLSAATIEEIKNIHKFILKNRHYYLIRKKTSNVLKRFINKIIVLGHLKYTQNLKERVLSGQKWPFKCTAGCSISVIYPNGNVGLCELLKPLKNIKQYNYNLPQLLLSITAKEKIESIKKNKCSCTHICFLNASLALDWKTPFKIFYFYLKSI